MKNIFTASGFFYVLLAILFLAAPSGLVAGKDKVLTGRVIFTADDHFEVKSGKREYKIYYNEKTDMNKIGADSKTLKAELCNYVRVRYKSAGKVLTAEDIKVINSFNCSR